MFFKKKVQKPVGNIIEHNIEKNLPTAKKDNKETKRLKKESAKEIVPIVENNKS